MGNTAQRLHLPCWKGLTDEWSPHFSICAKVTLTQPLTVAKQCLRSYTDKKSQSSTARRAAAANRSPHAPVQHIIQLGHSSSACQPTPQLIETLYENLNDTTKTSHVGEKHESRIVLNNTRYASARQPSGSAHPVSRRMAVPDLRREAAGHSLGPVERLRVSHGQVDKTTARARWCDGPQPARAAASRTSRRWTARAAGR